MAAELEHLINKLQSEAVAKAGQQSEEIISKARERAAGLVKDAETKSAELMAKAEKDAKQFMERSIRTLEQASRDLLITVGQGVENILDDLVRDSMDEAMNIDTIREMLIRMAEAYMSREGKERRVELLVSPDDQAELVKFYAGRYREKMSEGLEIRSDNDIIKGFKVSFVDDHVQHDFTREAIAEALAHFLRPNLAQIIHRATNEEAKKA